jgi:excisionase family DNA binding protein
MKPTRYTTEAELKALFDQAVRAIGFYEAQRKEVLMALESLRRALNACGAEAADAVATSSRRRPRQHRRGLPFAPVVPRSAAHDSLNAFIAYNAVMCYLERRRRITMTMLPHRQMPPSARDAALARASGQILFPYVQQKRPVTLRVRDADQEKPIELPPGAVALLMDILEAMAAGHGVTIIPERAELTTVQAADLLNVSRPFLIKLLDDGAIPHRKVGKHRRIRMEDVMAYKAAIDREREGVLDQLAREAQEQDMGYGRP